MAIVGRNGTFQSTMNIFRIFIILIILAFIALPVVWILSTSLSQRIAMFKLPPKLFSAFIIDNFKFVFTQMSINSWIVNSLIISFVVVFALLKEDLNFEIFKFNGLL